MTRKRLSTRDRLRIFELAKGTCHLCNGRIVAGEAWEVSHAVPLEMGGHDEDTNRFPAHKKCHRQQTSEIDIPMIAKAKRREARHLGARVTRNPIPGSKASGWKRKMNGEVVRR
jgi:5-methylcytosine-specific restriction protein A